MKGQALLLDRDAPLLQHRLLDIENLVQWLQANVQDSDALLRATELHEEVHRLPPRPLRRGLHLLGTLHVASRARQTPPGNMFNALLAQPKRKAVAGSPLWSQTSHRLTSLQVAIPPLSDITFLLQCDEEQNQHRGTPHTYQRSGAY